MTKVVCNVVWSVVVDQTLKSTEITAEVIIFILLIIIIMQIHIVHTDDTSSV